MTVSIKNTIIPSSIFYSKWYVIYIDIFYIVFYNMNDGNSIINLTHRTGFIMYEIIEKL